jgi:hypothetical protein
MSDNLKKASEESMDEKEIPKRYFLYWSGQDFKYVNYLTILSLLNTSDVEICNIYYEEVPMGNPHWDKLKNINNVRLIKLDYGSLISTAGMKKENFNSFFSKAKINHKSDLFRFLVLYCFGGVYLDFDILVIKDLTPLLSTKFFVAVQDFYNQSQLLNGAVMGSVKNSKVLMSCLKNVLRISSREREFSWSEFGPELITRQLLLFRKDFRMIRYVVRVLQKFGLADAKVVFFLYSLCTGRRASITIYPKAFFYYYSYFEWEKIFQKNMLPDEAYLIHFWQKFSGVFVKKIDKLYI